jgi:hypothetical protein
MKKFIILIPIYNDWDSLKKLLDNINENIKDIKNAIFECIVVNDSSTKKNFKIDAKENLKSIKIINMKENRGHQRCTAFGIKYIIKKINFDRVIIMDGDGEDRPEEIRNLVDLTIKEPNFSVVAKRVKRSEGLLFRSLYLFHKYLTLFFTGKLINFGNYTCLNKKDIINLSSKASLWSSFSGSLKKYIPEYNEIDSIRGFRYFGPSQMSLYKLIIHSFSIIAVFKSQVFFRTLILLILTYQLSLMFKINLIILQIFLIFFSLAIFVVSLRENKEALENSERNIESIEDITL